MSSLTRLGPSLVVPGAKGVFVTRALKKFTPIEVAPPMDAIAPPYMVNLLRTPLHTISLRRFLALRHQFSTGMYFNIATTTGWYLIVPGNHAPLADAAGLQAWRERHHHRYAQGTTRRRKSLKKSSSPNFALTSSVATGAPRGCDMSMALSEEGGDVMEAEGEDNVSYSAPLYGSTSLSNAPTPVASPFVISEGHLFEINDGVLWETPPQDDLANPEYWKHHKERMQIYEDTSVSAAQTDLFPEPHNMEGFEESAGLMEREMYTQQQRLLQALTRKANVRLNVDDDTSLLTLQPIMDLREGDELLLHYGREWWAQRLLSSLFMSVSDDEMRSVRWIEGLFTKPTDVTKPFPLICSAFALRKTQNTDKNGRKVEKDLCLGNNTAVSESISISKTTQNRFVLFNTMERRRATDAEALIFAVRRSCVDQEFFSTLVSAHGEGVFDVVRCDDEVPLCHLRRVLLHALRQRPMTTEIPCMRKEGEEDGSIVL